MLSKVWGGVGRHALTGKGSSITRRDVHIALGVFTAVDLEAGKIMNVPTVFR